MIEAASAGDWARFRGPHGSGVAADAPAPDQWSETSNIKWKTELPGPGSSSPIVVGDRVLLTCWTGYAAGGDGESGSLSDLKRTLVCIDRKTGEQLWSASVDAAQPEDSYRGMFAENGYASHTPVSDGKRVFAFFGKSGIHAYDMEGKPLWNRDLGGGRDSRGWGSASSPILHKNLVIVPAFVESRTIYALDQETGEVVWKQQADGFESTWGTPVLAQAENRTELIIGVPYEIWSLNPDTGKLLWFCDGPASSSMCSSVIVDQGVVYAVESGPGGGGSVAVRLGGKDNVNDTHVLWTGSDRSRIGTPVIHDGRMYWVSSGVINCIDIKTGKRVYQERLASGAGGSSSGGGNRGGRRGGQDYSSPVVAGGKLYYVRRSGQTHVVKLGEKFEQVATNSFAADAGDFHSTPAVSNGELFIRSGKRLYCIGQPE
jgi:hypothetical protein